MRSNDVFSTVEPVRTLFQLVSLEYIGAEEARKGVMCTLGCAWQFVPRWHSSLSFDSE
jgi:hypothetical protein